MFMIINLTGTEKDERLAEAVSELEDELTANGNRIYLDYKDGKYGYNTDAKRGADTFSPFSTGGGSEYNNFSTVRAVSGDKIGTIYGRGFISIKRISIKTMAILDVYIDGSEKFFVLRGNQFAYFYFNESIRFESGEPNDVYFYQLRLTNNNSPAYQVTQGIAPYQEKASFNGKGKALIVAEAGGVIISTTLDDSSVFYVETEAYQIVTIEFEKNISFMASTNLYYIVYTEL